MCRDGIHVPNRVTRNTVANKIPRSVCHNCRWLTAQKRKRTLVARLGYCKLSTGKERPEFPSAQRHSITYTVTLHLNQTVYNVYADNNDTLRQPKLHSMSYFHLFLNKMWALLDHPGVTLTFNVVFGKHRSLPAERRCFKPLTLAKCIVTPA